MSGVLRWQGTMSRRFTLCIIVFISKLLLATCAFGQTISLQFHNQGLGTLTVECQLQLPDGTLLVGTEDGLFFFNGVRFQQLGSEQNVPDSMVVQSITCTPSHDLVVAYAGTLYIAHLPDQLNDPTSLRFRAVLVPGVNIGAVTASGSDVARGLAPWKSGVLVLSSGVLFYIDLRPRDTVRAVPFLRTQDRFTAFAVRGPDLWVARGDGALCKVGQDAYLQCLSSHSGSIGEQWVSLTIGNQDRVFARSLHGFAVGIPSDGSMTSRQLPFVSDRYDATPFLLAVIEGSDGTLLTQWDHGLLEWRYGAWHPLHQPTPILADDLVSSILRASDGSIWIGFCSSGEAQLVGRNFIENWSEADGLSNNTVWSIARQLNGPLWIGTDNAIDTFDLDQTTHFRMQRRGYAISIRSDDMGNIWYVRDIKTVARFLPDGSAGPDVSLPGALYLAAEHDGLLWIGSNYGVYTLDTARPDAVPSRLGGLETGVSVEGEDRTSGLVWIFQGSELVGMTRAGIALRLPKLPGIDINRIMQIVVENRSSLWIVTSVAVVHVEHVGAHVTRVSRIGVQEAGIKHFVALCIDSRHWLWIGATNGVAVFDGKNWALLRTDDGLISNDIGQQAIFEDTDKTIWVGTSGGLSHITDPRKVFDQVPAAPYIQSIFLGGRHVRSDMGEYSTQGVDIDLGTRDLLAPNVYRFRYKLEGVDSAWRLTTADRVHYPYLPPGSHLFRVSVCNGSTKRVSPEIGAILTMPYPVWVRWPALVFYALSIIVTAYVAHHLWSRRHRRREKQLAILIDRQTHALREQARELEYQATHDVLTGLLNRRAMQRVLEDMRASATAGQLVFIALFDIDFFKHINDVYGHLAGDEVLAELGSRWRANVEAGSHIGRYGGEEFLFATVKPHASGFDSVARLRIAVTEPPFDQARPLRRVTLSAGATWVGPDETWADAMKRADAALYEAKESGRDRLVCVSPVLAASPVAPVCQENGR